MTETTTDLQAPTHAYVIYSADILGTTEEIDGMGPFRVASRSYPYSTPLVGDWTLTEGDESYDYGYLGDESGDATFYPYSKLDAEGLVDADDADEHDLQNGVVHGLGRHRKWVAELTLEQWQAVASALCIELEDDGYTPRDYEETLGSITEHGHLDAVCVDNTEGWTPTRVIDSSLYVSFGTLETDESASTFI